MNLLLKIILSGLLIGAISEIGRRYSTFAALVAALPFISLLSMIWIYHDTHDVQRIAQFSWSIFWYVLPSLIFFVLLPPLLLRAQLPFYLAMFLAAAATVAAFLVMKVVLGRFGIQL